VTLTEDNEMKIIQIVMKKDEIYGLCNNGQLWNLSPDPDGDSCLSWILIDAPWFMRERVAGLGEYDTVQTNNLFLKENV
jgi:hypothetical protein